jgi:hypothetical protein
LGDQDLDLRSLRFQYRLTDQHFVPNVEFERTSHHQYVKPVARAAKGIRFQQIAYVAAIMELPGPPSGGLSPLGRSLPSPSVDSLPAIGWLSAQRDVSSMAYDKLGSVARSR